MPQFKNLYKVKRENDREILLITVHFRVILNSVTRKQHQINETFTKTVGADFFLICTVQKSSIGIKSSGMFDRYIGAHPFLLTEGSYFLNEYKPLVVNQYYMKQPPMADVLF